MSQIDYKTKYLELKAKFLNTVDTTWRLGYEAGLKDAQLEQLQQQAQMAMQQPEPGKEQSGVEGEASEQPEETRQPSNAPNEDELGQHIEKLESMLGKSENISSLELNDLKKTLNDIRSLQVQINLTKSMDSIKNSRLTKTSPLNLSPKIQKNLPENSKKALTLQHEIVSKVMEKWESESKQAANSIADILNIEGLIKKD